MSLNTILSVSESVGINDQRFVGQTVSRNQKIFTSEVMTVVPFQFTLKPMGYLLYSQNRGVLNSLRIPDRAEEQYLNFSSTGWSNYVAYRGDLNNAQVSACQWQTSSTGNNLVLGNLPAVSSSAFIVRIGDFCQVGRYAYIATADVQRGISSTVTIPVHRPLLAALASPVAAVIGQLGTTQPLGGNSYVGVTFPVILRSYPTYTLMPITNDSFISWDGNFVAFENVL